jgi:hypothetical protein
MNTNNPTKPELIVQDMEQALKDAQSILEFTKLKLKDMGYV